MLIAAGIIALFAIFAGGPKNELMLLKINKYVKEYVVDDTRKTLILTELKEVKELDKTYKKSAKEQSKGLKALLKDPATDTESFNTFFDEIVDDEIKINEEYFKHRIVIQESLTQSEWDNIMNDMLKKFQKNDKSIQKIHKQFDKAINKVKKGILKEIKDEDRKEKADIALSDYLTVSKDQIKSILEFAGSEKETLLKKDATTEELMDIVNSDISLWKEVFDKYITLFNELQEISTPEEWPKVSKKLNNLLL